MSESTSPNTTIRPLRMSDHARLVALWRECGIKQEAEDSIANFERFLESPLSRGFGAIDSLEIVGTVLCGSDARYGYIHHLAVSPSYRRSGIATALVDECMRFLVSTCGLKTIAVFVWQTNTSGQQFWRGSGFDEIKGLNILVKEAPLAATEKKDEDGRAPPMEKNE